ncbi:pseudouridine synthase [Clostridioides difficile]|nr:pseudouridine synthase [Clostridioides difficile]AWH81274.1 pseudouridine synthase [Clostridioides difficile]EGT3892927.1 pseudouridine synthase [Clostridioides difficile]EGT3922650.1 pseudouridine synthase [Clostridioides difficile]EGT3948259.1 pseudouridine synthase [Clostridioides difficile]
MIRINVILIGKFKKIKQLLNRGYIYKTQSDKIYLENNVK